MESDTTFTQLKARVQLLDKEVSSLQTKLLIDQRPWFKQASTLIALFALVFSFGTTLISQQRAVSQEQRALKQELRGLVLELARQPIKGAELQELFTDPIAKGQLSSFLNQESTIIAEQAELVASRIPSLVSSTEYVTIALAFHSSGKFSVARRLREEAVGAAVTAIDALAALRQQAVMEFQLGNYDAARSYYESAVSVFTKLPATDAQVEDYSNAQTYFFWAQQEAAYSQCDSFATQLRTARLYANRLPAQTRDQLLPQISALESQGCGV